MAQETLVFILGVVLLIIPFLGIPAAWKVYGYVSIAVLLMVIGYRLRYARFLRSIETDSGERRTDSFTESDPRSITTGKSTAA